MRKNTRQVLEAFFAGKSAKPAASIWTDGDAIYSYGTALVARVAPKDGLTWSTFVLNATRYSVTTTIHQNAIATRFGPGVTEVVEDLPQGCDAEDLIAAAA